MRRKVKILTFAYLLFLVFSLLSGRVNGFISDLLFAFAFIVPTFLCIGLTRGVGDDITEYLRLDRGGTRLLLALGVPTVVCVMGVSYLTSLLIGAASGVTNEINVGDSFFLAVISLALLPAILEEMLFRFLPMKLLMPHSKRVCVLFSAFMFSAAHMSLFQIGYAMLAGIIFMLIDIASKSILPSVILHFANNVLSLVTIFYSKNTIAIICINVTICLLFVLSLAFFAIKRNKIIPALCTAFARGERMGCDPTPLLFIIPATAVALSDIIAKSTL